MASIVKVVAFIYAAVGLIVGGLLSIISLAGFAFGRMAGMDDSSGFIGMVFGAGAVIILPILYGIFGAIGGLIAGAVYNLVAGAVGGVQLDLEVDRPQSAAL